jgi:ABC-type dipeptide/oligopeptide/nickel transport system ATPase component
VEKGPAKRVIRQPTDEYTRRLLQAIPKLQIGAEGPAGPDGYVATAEPTKVHVGASVAPTAPPPS